jgi:non-specific serine/threonine protein kinase
LFQELHENLWVCRTSFLLAQAHMANSNLEDAKSCWEQGLNLCRVENDKFHIAWGLEGLGDMATVEGHFEQARELYIESLQLKIVVMDKTGIAYSLEAFAHLAAAQDQFRRAAVLWGAAEQLRQTLNSLRDLFREEPYRSQIATMRTQLGEEYVAKAWAEGRMMKMQEAIEYALALPSN